MSFLEDHDIACVAFDIDGTLYPKSITDRILVKTSLFHLPFALKYMRMRAAIRKEDGYGDFPSSSKHDMQKRQYELMYPHGHKGGLDAFLEKEKRVFHDPWLREFSSIKGYEGVQEAFERLSARLPVAILTDFPIGVKLDALGLTPYITYAVSSEDIGRLKPSACCFRVLGEKLDMAPERILYVGDSERKDVLGALNYKMHAVLITNDRKKAASSRADIVVSGYRELMDALL